MTHNKYSSKDAGKIMGALNTMADYGASILKNPQVQAAAVISGAIGLQHKLRQSAARKQRNKSFQQALALNPSLREEDPATLKRHFRSLSRFNPTMASDPTVAGAWLNQVKQMGSSFDEDAKDLAVLSGVEKAVGMNRFAPKTPIFDVAGAVTPVINAAAHAAAKKDEIDILKIKAREADVLQGQLDVIRDNQQKMVEANEVMGLANKYLSTLPDEEQATALKWMQEHDVKREERALKQRYGLSENRRGRKRRR